MDTRYQSEFDLQNEIRSITETLGDSKIIQIFVHSLASLSNIETLESHLSGLEKYAERALVLARSNDIVCALDEVDTFYLRFLSRLEVGPKPSNVIGVSAHHYGRPSLTESLMKDSKAISTIQELVKNGKEIFLNPFVVTSRELKLASFLQIQLKAKVHVYGGNPRVVEDAGYKHRVRQKAIEFGIPVADGEVVEMQSREDQASLRAATQRYLIETGKVIVKGSRGDAGSVTFIVDSSSESIQRVLNKIAESNDNNIYLVEPLYDLIVSPNILMNIGFDGTIRCVGITDQILTQEMKHEGNVYPSTAGLLRPMLDSSRKICEWLLADGYCGLLGLDFAEYFDPQTGERKYFLAEVNPRINAGVYSRSLMEHLNKRQQLNDFPFLNAFVSVNIKTTAGSFAELTDLCGHLFFQPETAQGLVPFNTGCLKYGKFTSAIFGRNREEVTSLHADLISATVAEEYSGK